MPSRRAVLPLLLLLLVLPAGVRALPRAVTPEELSLLTTALQRVADDFPRWAYTEHRVMRDSAGKVKSEQILRYDPSKPYDCLLYTSPSPRDRQKSRMPSSA